MTKDEKSKIKYRMKRLARKFCRRNRVYESFDGSVGKLIENGYLSAYLQCLHENKNKTAELEKENAGLKARLNAINLLTPELEKASKLRKRQLIKAKEIIKILKDGLSMYSGAYQKEIAEAERFLSEVKHD